MFEFQSILTLDFLPIPIYTHGLMIGLGVVVGYLLAYRRVKRESDFSSDTLDFIILFSVFGGIVGSRLLYVLLNHDLYSGIVEMLKIWEGGLVSFGGIIGGVLCGVLYMRYKRVNVWKWADILVPYFFLGWGIARIGDFLSWSEIGTPSNVPWAVAVDGDVPRHATQIYTTIVMTGMFFVFRWLYKKWKGDFGKVSCIAIATYGVFRFLIECIRDYPDNEYPFFYRYFAQIMSGIFIVVGVSLFYYCKKKFWKR